MGHLDVPPLSRPAASLFPLSLMGRIRLESSPSSPFDLLILNSEHAIFNR